MLLQALCPTSRLLAVGGRDVELRLHVVTTGEVKYSAKGAKPNMLGLVDKPWDTALAFLPSPGARGSSDQLSGGIGEPRENPGARLLVGTAHHKLRLYDASVGKRPQTVVDWEGARITAIAPEQTGKRCWIANGVGQIGVVELPSCRVVGGIRGAAGSVRDLQLHPQLPFLASVGLDRTLRVHSTASRQLVAKCYLKTQLTCRWTDNPDKIPEATLAMSHSELYIVTTC